MDTFVDVELALVWPVWADHPADRVSTYSEMILEMTYYAGHEPQLLPGTCAKSAMISALLYDVLLCTRTLFLPGPLGFSTEVVSTPI